MADSKKESKKDNKKLEKGQVWYFESLLGGKKRDYFLVVEHMDANCTVHRLVNLQSFTLGPVESPYIGFGDDDWWNRHMTFAFDSLVSYYLYRELE